MFAKDNKNYMVSIENGTLIDRNKNILKDFKGLYVLDHKGRFYAMSRVDGCHSFLYRPKYGKKYYGYGKVIAGAGNS